MPPANRRSARAARPLLALLAVLPYAFPGAGPAPGHDPFRLILCVEDPCFEVLPGNGYLPAASRALSSSIGTIAFLIRMPIRLSRPIRAVNPKGRPVSRSPAFTPISARGTVGKMTDFGFRIAIAVSHPRP